MGFLSKFVKVVTNPRVLIAAAIFILAVGVTAATGGVASGLAVAAGSNLLTQITLTSIQQTGPGGKSPLGPQLDALANGGGIVGMITVGSQRAPAMKLGDNLYVVGPQFDPQMEKVMKADGKDVQRVKDPSDVYMLRQQLAYGRPDDEPWEGYPSMLRPPHAE